MPDGATTPAFRVTAGAFRQVAEIAARAGRPPLLWLAVDAGGCSGFQYRFDFDAKPLAEDDILIERDGGVKVVIDKISLDYLKGSELDYVETLGAAAFEIKNPNATASCGCGNSFAV